MCIRDSFENYKALLSDPSYYRSLFITLGFSVSVTAIAMSAALILALMADRVLRARIFYRTFLIIPYPNGHYYKFNKAND